MTQVEQLEALVRKAIKNGWKPLCGPDGVAYSDTRIRWTLDDDGPLEQVILNKEFARALFGDSPPEFAYQFHKGIMRDCDNLIESGGWPAWKYHVVQAVVSNNPIDYMYKAVFGDE